MRRLVLPSVVTVLAGVPAMIGLASPAQAYATPTFSDVDVSTPGHGKVTVSTDAPYVAAWLRSTTLNVRVTDPAFLETAGGGAAVDLETWGVDSAQVMARACQTPDLTTCDPITLSPAFIPSTVDPVITWPADDTVGALDNYEPEVDDPTGGGSLVAVWQGQRTTLSPGTPVALPLAVDGTGSITVLRCSSSAPKLCQPTTLTHPIVVNRVLAAGGQTSPFYLNPDAAPVLLQLGVAEGLTQTFTFEWHVMTPAGDVVPNVGGVIENLTANDYGVIETQVQVSALSDGKFTLLGHLSYTDPEFGEVARTFSVGSFILDRVAPVVGSITFGSASLYPYVDGYLDAVRVGYHDAEESATAHLIITNADGLPVRTRSTEIDHQSAALSWNGRDDAGYKVDAGTYTMTAYADDAAGNTSTFATWAVKVVRERLEWTVFDHTYTAAQTLTHVTVGSCSSVIQPGSFHWRGSVELQSNEKCGTGGAPAVAETLHSVALPAGKFVTGELKFSVYGASPVDRLSPAAMFVRNGSGSWRRPVSLDQHVDWHPFTLNGIPLLLGRSNRLTWRVRVDHNYDKYCLGSFKVHLKAGTLVAE